MYQVLKYICSHCSKSYDYSDEAEQCEINHSKCCDHHNMLHIAFDNRGWTLNRECFGCPYSEKLVNLRRLEINKEFMEELLRLAKKYE
jgi:hypothetical protein